ncbi:MAG: transcription elongation factor GreA [Actinomycetota bacterium]
MKEYRLTKEGYDSLVKELDDLVKNKRKEVAERLKDAKNFGGDLSENSEYEYAKNEQAFIEGRIEQINVILQNYVIVDKNNGGDAVTIGSTVVLKDLEEGKKKKYRVVSSVESDPEKNKISDESPIGSSLLNKKVGDKIVVKTPQKKKKFKILDIV